MVETGYYTQKDVERFYTALLMIRGDSVKLRRRFASHTFKNDRAKEFAMQGFCRRVGTLVRCVELVYAAIPPEIQTLPDDNALTDATISLQSFIFNVFGCLDNLAWMWVSETNQTNRRGRAIPASYVGLHPRNEIVRQSLAEGTRKYLEEIDGWFGVLEDFRHALAHRIPLYIPPYVVPTSMVRKYQDIEAKLLEALIREDFDEHDRLKEVQESIVYFLPVYTHSFNETDNRMFIHSQMICDIMTVIKISDLLLGDLSAL